MMGSHGGSRQGAGRPSISKKQISVRVSNRTIKAIEAFGGDADISAAVRQIADFATGVNFCLDEESCVWATFTPFEEIYASTIAEAFAHLINFIKTNSSSTYIYACGRDLLTVKSRLPLGNGSSLWIFVAEKRMVRPTDDEFENDKQKILRALKARDLDVRWHEES
jgi:hypothetical protein